MIRRWRFQAGLALLLLIGLTGTLWFWVFEDFSLVEAAFQTTTTITTVGFGETRDFDTSAQIFSIVLMIVGVAAALFTFGVALEDLVEGSIHRFGRRRMDRRIAKFSDHFVLCGYGRVGRSIARSVGGEGAVVVVVEQDRTRAEAAADAGFACVCGDATEDDILTEAGIDRAAVVVISLQSDGDAISCTLSARSLAPQVRIVARANSAGSESKLSRAGVDHVVNPLRLGAEHLVGYALRPSVAGFLEIVSPRGAIEMRLEEFVVAPQGELVDRTLASAGIRELSGALVLGLRVASGEYVSNPEPDWTLAAGSTLIAIGSDDQLAALGLLAGPKTPAAR